MEEEIKRGPGRPRKEESERTLDKTRDHGVVLGDPKIGFEQDGAYFGHDGRYLEIWATPEQLQNERHQAAQRMMKEKQLAKLRDIRAQKQKLLETI